MRTLINCEVLKLTTTQTSSDLERFLLVVGVKLANSEGVRDDPQKKTSHCLMKKTEEINAKWLSYLLKKLIL